MSRNGDAFAPASRCCKYREAELDFAAASNYIVIVDPKVRGPVKEAGWRGCLFWRQEALCCGRQARR
jgi:hypothetical protein